MRTGRDKMAVALVPVLLVLGLLSFRAPSALAAIWQDQAWHSGRRMFDYYRSNGGCTSGPTFYEPAESFYWKASPAHCLEHSKGVGFGLRPFFSVYEEDHNGNGFDTAQVVHPRGAYEFYDVVLIALGHNPPARSRHVFDYCQDGNCSSHTGGGSANAHWAGDWLQVTSWVADPEGPLPVTMSGAYSGTNTGTLDGAHNVQVNGYDYWAYRISNIAGCGVHSGDSGASVIVRHPDRTATLLGMLTAGTTGLVAEPGNGCYPVGDSFGDTGLFLSVGQVQRAFAHLGHLVPYI